MIDDTYLVCMYSWLHGGEWGGIQGPRPGHGWDFFRNLVFCPKPVVPTNCMRAIPRRNGGSSRTLAPIQVLRNIGSGGTVREGVGVRHVVTADAFCTKVLMSGRKRRCIEARWAGLKEEWLAGGYRLIKIKVEI